jgi:hypothetical protein
MKQKKQAAPKKTDVAAAPPVATIATSSTSARAKNPNGNVLDLVRHAASLGATVRTHLAALATAKVTAADATSLEQGAVRLRALETAWLEADAASTPGAVAKARAPLRESRDTLFGDIAAYVDDDDGSVAKALHEIGGVVDDDDLESDVGRLIALARRHADNLAGTELTPAIVDLAAAHLKAFEQAREGAVASTGQTKAALVAVAHSAAAARNAAYWPLLRLDQLVCKRGRRRFRKDLAQRAGFAAFSTAKRRGVKKAATTRRKQAKAKKAAVATG